MSNPTQWYDFTHPTTERIYAIRYYYEAGDKTRKCTIHLKPLDSGEEEEIRSFDYPAERHEQIDEQARVIAIQDGEMRPPEGLN